MNIKDISNNLSLISKLMDITGGNSFKVRAFENASRKIVQTEDVEDLIKNKQLSEIKGIGKSIGSVVYELYNHGKSELLDELKNNIPEGILDMLTLKGLGAKKIKILFEKLGITSVGELEYACNENRLLILKGFGEKTQKNILKSIGQFKTREKNLHYPSAMEMTKDIFKLIYQCDEHAKIAVTGKLRRKCEILEKVELVLMVENLQKFLNNFEIKHEVYDTHISNESIKVIAFKKNNLPVFIYLTDRSNFKKILFITTGSEDFIKKFLPVEKFSNEKNFFITKKTNYIPPECRENYNLDCSKLLNYNELQGMFHVHSNYSDGINSLEEIVQYLIKRKFQYLGISDHSKSAFYANGLKEDDIKRQHEEIDKLNEKYQPFKIFKGIESDILKNGDLDYSENILEKFDFVIASIHSSFNLNKKDMTKRLIKAVENPYTTIIGHPTGRLLLYREGYEIDYEEFLDSVACNGKFIEINSHPFRLDLSWENCIKAKKTGIKFFITPDAHNLEGFEYIKYGVNVARKAGLTKYDIVNTGETDEILKLI